MDAYSFMNRIDGDPALKIIDYDRTIFQNVVIYDVSLKLHGPQEDKIYVNNPFFLKELRRGNTVIQILEGNMVKDTIWGRKGMNKFFDLQNEYLTSNPINDPIYKTIFKTITFPIKVYKLIKANGENAQVSYVESLECWIIASKNVSLLAKSKDDLEIYTEDRFHFAKLIAQTWFDILEKSDNKEAIQKTLTNKTLVGEYCGNKNYQHLIKYDKVTIYWFALVDHNQKNFVCIPVEKTQEIIKSLNLDLVKSTYVGEFQNIQDLKDSLRILFNKVAQASIEEEQEGSVIYFETVIGVIGNCKLKTLEYRIYRKIREKLKNFLQSQKKEHILFQQYQNQVKELIGDNQPHKDLLFYESVFKKAFEMIKCYPKDPNLIHSQFIDFLDQVLQSLDQKQSPQQQNFIMMMEQTQNNKEIIVLLAIGIPGMGKTTFFNQILQSENRQVLTISSDKIRQKLILDLKQRSPLLSVNDLFKRTGQNANREYESQIFKAFTQFKQSNYNQLILCLDKNHPPNGIAKGIQLIRKYQPQNIPTRIMALTQQFEYIKDQIYLPYNWNYFFTCIKRVQSRQQHETLPGNGTESLSLLIMFITLFINFNIKNYQFDSIIEINFTEQQLSLNYEMINRLRQLLKNTRQGEMCGDIQGMEQLDGYIKQIQVSNKVDLNKYNQIIQTKILQQNKNMILSNSMDQHQQKKIPVYLGIFLKNTEKAKLQTFINDILDKYHVVFGHDIDYQLILKQFRSLNLFHWVDNLHVTTLYIGNNRQKLDSPTYKNFKENVEYQIELTHLFFSPFNIICGLVKVNAEVENKYAHITLLTQKLKAKDSNEIIQKCLEGGFEKWKKMDIIVQTKIPVFAIELQDKFLVEGISQAFNG